MLINVARWQIRVRWDGGQPQDRHQGQTTDAALRRSGTLLAAKRRREQAQTTYWLQGGHF